MEKKLSNEEKDRLISLVKENPCLYDSTSKGNKDNEGKCLDKHHKSYATMYDK